jgi:zinc transport system permease protein
MTTTTVLAAPPMLDDFLVRAALAGTGAALAAAPLGCFVVWRRMAYFGDAIAHAALLGVALSLAFSLSIEAGVLLVSVAIALAVGAGSGRRLAMDTLLGVAAHGALAIGLVAISLTSRAGLDLDGYLFGEILSVTRADVAMIWIGGAAVLALLAWRWSAMLTATLGEDLAWASGVDPRRERMILVLAMAIVVAVSIKVVGALLITALLIIPAATARPLARGPEAMAVFAAVAGVISALGGLWASWRLDTPTGPTIVAAAAGLFILSGIVSMLRGVRRFP